jgi:hypothetical protein
VQDQLLITGVVDEEAFEKSLSTIKSLFDAQLNSFYIWTEPTTPLYSTEETIAKDKLTIALLKQPNRSASNLNIDSILKQNIRDDGTLLCNRCGQQTQIILPLDPGEYGDFQTFPPWLNAFQDQCFCGGSWAAFVHKDH